MLGAIPTLPLRLPTFFSVKVGAGGNAWLNVEGMVFLILLSWGDMKVSEGQGVKGECRIKLNLCSLGQVCVFVLFFS